MSSSDYRQSTGELTDEEEISTYKPAAEVTTSGVVSTGDEDDQLKCRICKRFYTDARSLRCAHDFCLSCLCTFQTTTEDKACAVCGEMTVPPAEQIKLLVSNRDLNARVGKVMLRIAQEKRKIAENAIKCTEKGTKNETPEKEIHVGVTCDNCGEDVRGFRYKCGMCENYDLCELCEVKPRKDIHNPHHLFIKLKQPTNILLNVQFTQHGTPKPALVQKAKLLGKTMDFSSVEHAVDIGELGMIGVKRGIRCDGCKINPIKGVRYKCGCCEGYDLCEKCEKKSHDVHDTKHVFIKIPHPFKQIDEPMRWLQQQFY